MMNRITSFLSILIITTCAACMNESRNEKASKLKPRSSAIAAMVNPVDSMVTRTAEVKKIRPSCCAQSPSRFNVMVEKK